MTNIPMHPTCGAHCRTTGEPCKNYPVTGKQRCRMHGGKRSGRPVKNGFFTKEALAERGRLIKLNREVRNLLKELKS